MNNEQPKKRGRPTSPPARKAQWARVLPLRISPDLYAAYHAAAPDAQAAARAAMIAALAAALA